MSSGNFWHGIEGIYFIWHGEWSTPEITDGENICFDSDVENGFFEEFCESNDESCYENYNDFLDGFASFMKRREPEEIKRLIAEAGHPLTEKDKSNCFWQIRNKYGRQASESFL